MLSADHVVNYLAGKTCICLVLWQHFAYQDTTGSYHNVLLSRS